MLKSNSKKVRQAVREYIAKNTSGWDADPKDFHEACEFIQKEWNHYKHPDMRKERKSLQEQFNEFARGLPNNVFDYIAYGDTTKLVGDMMEQTESERAKYSDSQACDLLTYLIFDEVNKEVGIDF